MKRTNLNAVGGRPIGRGAFPECFLTGGASVASLPGHRGRWMMSRTPDSGDSGRGGGRSPRRKSRPSPLGRIVKTGGIILAGVLAAVIALGGVVFFGQKLWRYSRQLAAEKRLADPVTNTSSSQQTSDATIGESTVSARDAKKNTPMERSPTDPVIRISNPRRGSGRMMGGPGITVDYEKVFVGENASLTMVLRHSNGDESTASMGSTLFLEQKGTMTAESSYSVLNNGPKYEDGVEIYLVVSDNFGMPLQFGGIGSGTCKVSNSVTFGANASITYAIHRPTKVEQAALDAEAKKNRELADATRLETLKSAEIPSGYSKVVADTPLVPGTQVTRFGTSGWTEPAEVVLAGEQQAHGKVKVHTHGVSAVFETETSRSEIVIADEVLAVLKTSPGSIRSEIARHEQVGRSASELLALVPDYVQVRAETPLRPGINVKWQHTTEWADYTIVRVEGERMATIRLVGGEQEYFVNRTDLVMDFFFQADLQRDPNASQPPPPLPRKGREEIEQDIQRALNSAQDSLSSKHSMPDIAKPSASRPAFGKGRTANYDGPHSVPSSGLTVSKASQLKIGQIVQVKDAGAWYPADILKKNGNGTFRIHFRGWGNSSDEDVPLNQIQLRPEE